MDIAMVLGGAVIALLQGMDPEGIERVSDTLHRLAEREACSPAERHIFQVIADSVSGELVQPVRRKAFQVIEGGAA